ncbi:MAG TPA: tRNA (adenosine(37)-N6)-dimethylallyltransferase MiaA [Bacteroidetes bacterium]|nr:tRNA (adenosine(37)-N6)-dimethylallyltransferase MiaA [Candidatus Limimorpha avicola]
MDKYLIVLAGPTASGKTMTAIKIALALNTEIISADSRQFYKELSIGTAAPTALELSTVKHYLVHHLSIFDKYDVSDYEHDVISLTNRLFKKHNAIVLTGGSGMFIDAVCDGLDDIPDINDETRKKISDLLQDHGITCLQELVSQYDPEYYSIVDKNNPRRLQRALEVYFQTGIPYSSFRKKQKKKRDFKILRYALLWDRDALIERINKRVDIMMHDGLLDEVRTVYPYRELNSLNTVGYKELFDFLDGKCSLEDATDRIKINTRQYAKRQMTWFRKNDEYKWFAIEETDDIISSIKHIVK